MLGSFIVIKNIISEELYSFMKKSIKAYLKKQYGFKSDICIIDVKDGYASYQMSSTRGQVPASFDGIEGIRYLCGQHILMRHGLPTAENPPFVLKLFVTPSFIKRFGIRKSISFCKNWIGDSKVGELIVVKYI